MMSTSPPLLWNRLIFLLFLRLTAIIGCHGLSLPTSNHSGSSSYSSSRRKWIRQHGAALLLSLQIVNINQSSASAAPPSQLVSQLEVEELPREIRKFTALAPLGDDAATTTKALENKLTGLSLEDIATKLSHDLVDGSTGKGGYFISGMCNCKMRYRSVSGTRKMWFLFSSLRKDLNGVLPWWCINQLWRCRWHIHRNLSRRLWIHRSNQLGIIIT